MKQIAFITAFLGAGLACAQNGPLSVDEAIRLAEEKAFSVRLSKTEVEKSRQRIFQARSLLLPRLDLSANYTRFDEASVAQFGPDAEPITVQPIDTSTAALTLSWPIDIFGQVGRLATQAGSAAFQSSKFSLEATRRDLARDVRKQFYAVLRSENLVKVAQQGVVQSKSQLNQAELLFRGDQIARIDVERLKAQLKQTESDLIGTKNLLELQRNLFNLLLARPIETPVSLQDPGALPDVVADPDGMVTAAQAKRPEILSLSKAIDAQDGIRRATEGGLYPTLALSVTHQRNLKTGGFGARDSSTVGVISLGIPIFDAGGTRARVREQRQNVEALKIQLEQLKLAISQEVRSALRTLEDSRSRLQAAEAQVSFAEETLRLANIRQQAGEATAFEIVDAQTAVTAARNSAVSARFDTLSAYADLLRALGGDMPVAAAASAEEVK